MYYDARMYDPALGTFISPDTIVPDPTNPQSLNRYAYSYNNPLRYRDPSGHDAEDVFAFAAGALQQWAYDNAWLLPPQQEALAVDLNQYSESPSYEAGRQVGNIVALGQGAYEVIGGFGTAGGGLAVCGTGALCPVGVAAVGVGAVAVANGGALVGTAAQQELMLLSKGANSETPPPTVYRGGSSLTPGPNDIKIDKTTGKVLPVRGVSLFSDPAKVEKFGGAFRIDSLPDGLKIIQRGIDLTHYEIVPVEPMELDRFVELLNKVTLNPVSK